MASKFGGKAPLNYTSKQSNKRCHEGTQIYESKNQKDDTELPDLTEFTTKKFDLSVKLPWTKMLKL